MKRYSAEALLSKHKIDSLAELVEGKFPRELAELFTAEGEGLFPTPGEIEFSCSCPDWIEQKMQSLLENAGKKSGRVLDDNAAAALFGDI